MFQGISDWIFHRALRISSASVIKLAKATKQDPKKIVAVNNALAGIAATQIENLALGAVEGKQ